MGAYGSGWGIVAGGGHRKVVVGIYNGNRIWTCGFGGWLWEGFGCVRGWANRTGCGSM